jgi:hypothetical protein
MSRVRHGLEAILRDFLPADLAPAIDSFGDARQGGVDLLDELLFVLQQVERKFLLRTVTA